MATRRISLIPPPPFPASPGERRDSASRDSERWETSTARATVPKSVAKVGHTGQLPTAYRGKSSGEFQRVAAPFSVDVNVLVAQAEQCLLELAPEDNYRRLLQLAVLRRDAGLLSGLLAVIRRGD